MKIEEYKDLPDEIYAEFDNLTDTAYELFEMGKIEESFKTYEKVLAIIPEPKSEYADSSSVIEWMVDNYLKIKNYPKAISWVENLGEYLKNKEILGDWDFLKGKVYFEAGDYAKAFDNFKAAYSKTKEDTFVEADPKYLKFYKNPDKYIK